jgi:DNA invertase Pin-like site-specific DNA recombinase
LGLDAQREALARFAADEDFEIVRECVDVESGNGADALDGRPQLAAALSQARQRHCAVAVAKLDCLGRDVDFISAFLAEGVPLVVAGHATGANPFVLYPYAALADDKRLMIPARIRHAVARTRARELAKALKAAADRRAAKVLPIIKKIQRAGATTLRAIARELNARGVPTTQGRLWQPQSVANVLARRPIKVRADLNQPPRPKSVIRADLRPMTRQGASSARQQES